MAALRHRRLAEFANGAFRQILRICCLFGSIGIIASKSACYAQNQTDTTYVFKSFLTNPPVIKEVFFSRKLNRRIQGVTNQVEYFFARRQTDAFVIRDVRNRSELDSTNTRLNFLVGRYGNTYWSISGDGKADLLEYWIDNQTPTTNNPVKMTAAAAQNILNNILKMGATLVDFQKAVWTGNAFTTVSVMGEPIKGTLLVEDRMPKTLTFKVGNNAFFSNRTEVVDYYYETNAGVFYLPNRIEMSDVKDSQKTLIAECMIISIEISVTNLNEDLFNAKHYYVPIGMSTLFFTNNAEYALRMGKLESTAPKDTVGVKREKWLIRVILVALFLMASFICARQFWRPKQTTNEKKY